LRGAKIIFCDFHKHYPNLDEDATEELITDKTKAIVPVHYMDFRNMENTEEPATYDLAVVEDAAQAINSSFRNKPPGELGTFGTISFHEQKTLIARRRPSDY
jgi:dTDP-4-amino-4,6-dideoxygalactose transaminase